MVMAANWPRVDRHDAADQAVLPPATQAFLEGDHFVDWLLGAGRIIEATARACPREVDASRFLCHS
jgi:hypothetical protein